MPFQRGQPKIGGRKKGTPNKLTTDVGMRCRALIESPDYVSYFEHRLRNGALPPLLEAMTWRYAYGDPPKTLVVSGPGGGPIPYTWLAPQL